MTHRQRAATIAALIVAAASAAATITTARALAHWPTLHGRASVFGNDPVIGFTDIGDNGIRALDGKPTALGGLAVYDRRTLGGWWWTCPPPSLRDRRCHLIRQTDIGPAPSTGRIVDITTVAARRAYQYPGLAFPTDLGTWTLRYRGHR